MDQTTLEDLLSEYVAFDVCMNGERWPWAKNHSHYGAPQESSV